MAAASSEVTRRFPWSDRPAVDAPHPDIAGGASLAEARPHVTCRTDGDTGTGVAILRAHPQSSPTEGRRPAVRVRPGVSTPRSPKPASDSGRRDPADPVSPR